MSIISKENTNVNTKNRIKILDVLRGLCILLMVYHHAAFLIKMEGLFKKSVSVRFVTGFIDSGIYQFIWFVYVCMFFILAGISSNFSRNNFKRALKVGLAALVVSAATFVIYPQVFINFGVLHCMCICILIHALLHKTTDKIHIFVYPVLFLLWYFVLGKGYFIDAPNIPVIGWISAVIGFPVYGYSALDYFPLLPWIFIFLFGTKLGIIIKARKFPDWFYEFDVKPLSFTGKFPLIIYLAHQPILLGVFYLIERIVK